MVTAPHAICEIYRHILVAKYSITSIKEDWQFPTGYRLAIVDKVLSNFAINSIGLVIATLPKVNAYIVCQYLLSGDKITRIDKYNAS